MKTIGQGFLLGIGIFLADIFINKICKFLITTIFITNGEANQNIFYFIMILFIISLFALVIAIEIKRTRSR